jgi:hypothetical protein
MTELNYQVAAGADDGQWCSDSSFSNSSTSMKIGVDYIPIGFNSFARWDDVTLPDGVTIVSATLSIYVISWTHNSEHEENATCKVYFEDAADPSAVSSASNGDGKTKTTAYTSVVLNKDSGWQDIDVKAIVEELLASNSYASGAAMQALLMYDHELVEDYTAYDLIRTKDYTTYERAPKLQIVYSVAGGATVAAQVIII